jgi:hypothetical protein
MAGVRLMQPSVQTIARWFPVVRTGVLRSSNTDGVKQILRLPYLTFIIGCYW